MDKISTIIIIMLLLVEDTCTMSCVRLSTADMSRLRHARQSAGKSKSRAASFAEVSASRPELPALVSRTLYTQRIPLADLLPSQTQYSRQNNSFRSFVTINPHQFKSN